MTDATGGENDDHPNEYERPPWPSPSEVRRRWAKEGNVQAILHLIRNTVWSNVSVGEQLQNLLAACRAGAKADPEGFSRDVFTELVGLTAFLSLRTQLSLTERAVGRGPMTCTPTLADFSADVTERVLPRVLDLQRGMVDVLHAQAATARMWALARAKEAQAGRAAAAARGASPRDDQAAGGAARPGRKRAGGEGEGGAVVSLPVRGRRRG